GGASGRKRSARGERPAVMALRRRERGSGRGRLSAGGVVARRDEDRLLPRSERRRRRRAVGRERRRERRGPDHAFAGRAVPELGNASARAVGGAGRARLAARREPGVRSSQRTTSTSAV